MKTVNTPFIVLQIGNDNTKSSFLLPQRKTEGSIKKLLGMAENLVCLGKPASVGLLEAWVSHVEGIARRLLPGVEAPNNQLKKPSWQSKRELQNDVVHVATTTTEPLCLD